MSPKWVDRFEFTLREAKRLGLGIDMAHACLFDPQTELLMADGRA